MPPRSGTPSGPAAFWGLMHRRPTEGQLIQEDGEPGGLVGLKWAENELEIGFRGTFSKSFKTLRHAAGGLWWKRDRESFLNPAEVYRSLHKTGFSNQLKTNPTLTNNLMITEANLSFSVSLSVVSWSHCWTEASSSSTESLLLTPQLHSLETLWVEPGNSQKTGSGPPAECTFIVIKTPQFQSM